MDKDSFLIMNNDIDLDKIEHINSKRTIAFLNHWIMKTVIFLNRFSHVCEEKLLELDLRIKKTSNALAILEGKLNSVPGLQDKLAETSQGQIVHKKEVEVKASENLAESAHETTMMPAALEHKMVVSNDPRYKTFFKMVAVGVPREAVKLKMVSIGLDPSLLDTPDAEVSVASDPVDPSDGSDSSSD